MTGTSAGPLAAADFRLAHIILNFFRLSQINQISFATYIVGKSQ